jgi:hypothetical protein
MVDLCCPPNLGKYGNQIVDQNGNNVRTASDGWLPGSASVVQGWRQHRYSPVQDNPGS